MSKPDAGAKHGCLHARQWQDIRNAARLAKSQGIKLVLHGVTIDARMQDIQLQPAKATPVRDDDRQSQVVTSEIARPSSKQHEQHKTRAERRRERSLTRVFEHQLAQGSCARWVPPVR